MHKHNLHSLPVIGLWAALFAVAGCTVSHPATADRNANTQNPIMPIYYTGEAMHIYLTDYIPQSTPQDAIAYSTEPSYRVQNPYEGEFDLVGDNTLSVLSVCVNDTLFYDIPILPALRTVPGMVTHAATDSTLQVRMLHTYERVQLRAFWQDQCLPPSCMDFGEGDTFATLHLDPQWKNAAGRTFLRVYAIADGQRLNDLLIPLQDGLPVTSTDQLTRHDDQAQVLYSVLIDRFYNGNKANDWKLHSPEVLDIVDYQGGDLKGIQQKIEEGFFDRLGITTLWISPITQNPWDAWGKYPFRHGNKYDPTKTYTKFSGYHGYWPIYTTMIDRRFGTEQELHDLLATAHAHNMNVILDYVANHLHIASPVYQEHPTWHTDSILPDGRRNFELWDEARLTTWFDTHIPTLDLEREEVCEAMTDSALYWIENYDFDGYRHDACKHIPEAYWRTFVHKMKTRYPDRHLWMIGETYGSPKLINTYVKTGMLNAQFDFNVYFTAIHALCGDGTMRDIQRVILESLATYGAHHTMGCISGNHDQVRFASLAGGAIRFDQDGKEEGWTRQVGLLPNDTPTEQYDSLSRIAYRRALQLEMLNLTLPGVPCIYQGDEYGEVGGNDPDNRHLMRFDGRTEQEQVFARQVEELIRLRRQNMALLYGEYIPVAADDDCLAFERSYMGETLRVQLNRDKESTISRNREVLFRL